MQQIITIPVRYIVAKFELTFLIPILAKIVVNDVATAATNANISHNILSLLSYYILFMEFKKYNF